MRQYDNSPIIQSIIGNWSDNFDTSALIDNFYNTCFNINTCTGIWLDLWGVKVDVPRGLQVPSTEVTFGFNESGNDWLPFNDGVFYNSDATQSYSLSDEAYRALILSKAAANITSCTAKSINDWLNKSYGTRGNCYCHDNNDMTGTYYFNFSLLPWEISILTKSDLLPRPAGVKITLNVLGVTYSVN